MSPGKAAKRAANTLMRAFNALVLQSEAKIDSPFERRSMTRAPSDQFYSLNAGCLDAIDKAAQLLAPFSGTYALEDLTRKVHDLVIAVKDSGTAVNRAHEEIRQRVLSLLDWLSKKGKWIVVCPVRGVGKPLPFTAGRCSFYSMDEATFHLWGQRQYTGRLDPPGGSPILRDWRKFHGELIGQVVVETEINAIDAKNAELDGAAVIEESLNLLRYGRVLASWAPLSTNVPEVGLDARGFLEKSSLCMRLDVRDFSATMTPAGESPFGFLRDQAAAWGQLNAVLKVPAMARTEMQRRIVLALSWVGQSALAAAKPVQLVAVMTALESLLILDEEWTAKKQKLAFRVASFPKLAQAREHVDAKEVERLYMLRSRCVHGGAVDLADQDIKNSALAVAQCLSGLLTDEQMRNCSTLTQALVHLRSVTAAKRIERINRQKLLRPFELARAARGPVLRFRHVQRRRNEGTKQSVSRDVIVPGT